MSNYYSTEDLADNEYVQAGHTERETAMTTQPMSWAAAMARFGKVRSDDDAYNIIKVSVIAARPQMADDVYDFLVTGDWPQGTTFEEVLEAADVWIRIMNAAETPH